MLNKRPFQATSALLIQEFPFGFRNILLRAIIPFQTLPFFYILPFWDRMPFQTMNTLSGHKYSFVPRKPFQDEVVLLGQRCPFGTGQDSLARLGNPFRSSMPFSGRNFPIRPRMPLSYHKCLIRPIMPLLGTKITINHSMCRKQQSATKVIADSHSLFTLCVLGLIN